MTERVQKILRQWGIASRREAENMIEQGRVKVNGKVVKLGDQADEKKDKIELDGKLLQVKERPSLIYLLVNKPKDYICTCDDPQGRKTVLNLLPSELQSGYGIHPVGRLDRNSTGALILTNDGSLTLRLTHPRYHLPKTYLVTLQGSLPDDIVYKWSQGIVWEGKKTLPADILILQRNRRETKMEITLKEGRNRQIRNIADLLGYPVISLHRRAIGFLTVSSLGLGGYRHLTKEEIKKLQKIK